MFQKLRNILVITAFLMVLVPVSAAAQLPARSPDKFSIPEWETYSKKLLLQLRPEDKDLIDRVTFQITLDSEINAYTLWVDFFGEHHATILINYGLIKLLDNEGQFAFVLCHEFFHFKDRHPFNLVTLADGRTKIFDYDTRLKNERKSDYFAEVTIIRSGYNPCDGYIIAKKSFGDPDFNKVDDLIGIGRLKMMEKDCIENTFHIPGKADPGPK